MTEHALDGYIDALAAAVAAKVVDRLLGDSDVVDQHASPLGPRRFIRAVRAGDMSVEPLIALNTSAVCVAWSSMATSSSRWLFRYARRFPGAALRSAV